IHRNAPMGPVLISESWYKVPCRVSSTLRLVLSYPSGAIASRHRSSRPCRRASHVRSVCADPTYEPQHYTDDQNNPQDTAEPRGPIATVRVVPTATAKNQNQQNDDKNGAHASTSRRTPGHRIGTPRRCF